MGDEGDLLEREAAASALRRLADGPAPDSAQPHIEALARALERDATGDGARTTVEARSAIDAIRGVRPSTRRADLLTGRAERQSSLSRGALAITSAIDATIIALLAWQYDASDGRDGGGPLDSWASEFGGRYDHPSLEVVVVGNLLGVVVIVALTAFARRARTLADEARRAAERWAGDAERLALRAALLLGLDRMPLPPAAPGASRPRPMALESGLGLTWRADDAWATATEHDGTFSSSWSVAVGPEACWAEVTPRLVDEVLGHAADEPVAYLTLGTGSELREVEVLGSDVDGALRIGRSSEWSQHDLWRLEIAGWAWVWVGTEDGADRFGVITDRRDRSEVDDVFERTATTEIRAAVGIGIGAAFARALGEVGIDDD